MDAYGLELNERTSVCSRFLYWYVGTGEIPVGSTVLHAYCDTMQGDPPTPDERRRLLDVIMSTSRLFSGRCSGRVILRSGNADRWDRESWRDRALAAGYMRGALATACIEAMGRYAFYACHNVRRRGPRRDPPFAGPFEDRIYPWNVRTPSLDPDDVGRVMEDLTGHMIAASEFTHAWDAPKALSGYARPSVGTFAYTAEDAPDRHDAELMGDGSLMPLVCLHEWLSAVVGEEGPGMARLVVATPCAMPALLSGISVPDAMSALAVPDPWVRLCLA